MENSPNANEVEMLLDADNPNKAMKTIDESEFKHLCAEMCVDRNTTWRSHHDLGKEDALWWDIFRRLCHYLGEQPQLIGDSGQNPFAAVCRYNILRVVLNRRDGQFNALQIAYNYVREALQKGSEDAITSNAAQKGEVSDMFSETDADDELWQEERRRHDRSRRLVDVFFEDQDGTGVASTKDISVGGLYMNTLVVLREGARLMLRIPFGAEQVVVNAEVIYSNPGHGVGVRFHNLSEKDRAVIERVERPLVNKYVKLGRPESKDWRA